MNGNGGCGRLVLPSAAKGAFTSRSLRSTRSPCWPHAVSLIHQATAEMTCRSSLIRLEICRVQRQSVSAGMHLQIAEEKGLRCYALGSSLLALGRFAPSETC